MISALTLAIGLTYSGPTITPTKEMFGMKALAFAPAPTGSKFAATFEDKSVKIIDANTRQVVRTFTGHPQPAYAIAWSHDGAYIATGDESARIFVWDTRTGQKVRTFQGHIRGIQNLSFNYPRTLLMSTGKDDVIKIWNMSTGKVSQTILGKGANFFSATFVGKLNEFGTALLGSGARLYDANGKVMNFFTGHNNMGCMDIDFNANGTRAVTAGRDNSSIVWDVKTYKKLNSLKGDTDWVVHSKFSPNGKLIATSSVDRFVRVYDVNTFHPIAELDNESGIGSPLCFTSDGKFLLSVNINDNLQINTVNPPQPASGAAEKPAKGKSKSKGKRKH